MKTVIGNDITSAAAFLQAGELVAIPTETVYGLAANALNEDAVLKIYAAKNRPQFNPLIMHVASFEQAKQYIKDISAEAELLAAAFWPGPLTMLFNKQQNVPDLVTAGSKRVAIRVPNHPLTLQLLSQINFPVAAPSANPSGYVSPTTAQHVYEGLQDKIPYILDGGACGVGVESTIVGWNEDIELVLYRLGGIAVEAIEKVIGKEIKHHQKITDNPNTPGQLKSHYATNTPLYLGNIDELLLQFAGKKIILINFNHYHSSVPKEQQFILSANGSKEEAAKNLFRVLREADQLQADVILAEYLPEEGLGRAVNDRLERAQHSMKS
ncbi:L-threonylcarbamoyladenylate synthase [Lacibacter cauensis]|uniref:Threonylcarbamoyl-AMP synthase n=1 Tax=Lacibacter cauensis TaxID=510947 RepID=A0A562SXH9_9BACT|nr:L-threonylcarbamoyladenylate synthase [Lacibacter cauensis]TWI85664.1 L-threonylcarbamoyladenylate synthase [Lacibacter cauensis]